MSLEGCAKSSNWTNFKSVNGLRDTSCRGRGGMLDILFGNVMHSKVDCDSLHKKSTVVIKVVVGDINFI